MLLACCTMYYIMFVPKAKCHPAFVHSYAVLQIGRKKIQTRTHNNAGASPVWNQQSMSGLRNAPIYLQKL